MTENKSTDRNKNSDDDLKQIITRVGFLTRMLRESMREPDESPNDFGKNH